MSLVNFCYSNCLCCSDASKLILKLIWFVLRLKYYIRETEFPGLGSYKGGSLLHVLAFTNVYSWTVTTGTGPLFASTSDDIETYIRSKQSPSPM